MAEGPDEPLTVDGAIQTISKLEGLEIGLFQRTEGLTNILWGLLVPGMFFSYFALGAQYPESGPVWGPLLWIPWIAAGILATAVLWRSTHLAANAPQEATGHRAKTGLARMGVFTIVMFLGFMVFGVFLADLNLRLREPGYMMGLLSLAIILVAFFTRNRATIRARRAHVVVGILGLLATAVLAFASAADAGSAYFWQTVVGAVVLGGGWLLSGVYLALKG